MMHRLMILVLVLVASMAPAAALAQPAPSPRENGDLLFAADFNGGPGGLQAIFGTEYMVFEVGNGLATLKSDSEDIIAGAAIINQSFADFIAEVDLTVPTVVEGSCVGLYFRSTGSLTLVDAVYVAEICPDSTETRLAAFRAAEREPFFQMDEPLPDSYRVGGTNRLRVEAVGDQLTLFVNGVHALSATEGSVLSGGMGLALGVPEGLPDGVTVSGLYDNLRIYAPGAATAPASPAGAATAAKPGAMGGETTAKTLNVRSGPGTSNPVVGKLSQGAQVTIVGRNAACSWVQVAGSVSGWVSSQYVVMDGACSSLPDTTGSAAPAAAPSASAPSASAPAASAPASSAPKEPELLHNFEVLGTWPRGDEAWGTLEPSTARSMSGKGSGLLEYAFPANAANNYVVFHHNIPMDGRPNRLWIEVYGDGSGNLLNAWVTDATGQVWQFHFGPVNHVGWKRMVATMDPALPWPTSLISGTASEKRLDYPVSFNALVLDNPGNNASSGVLYVDDLRAQTR
jgi:hypothetical protein